ncbi:MAG: hypothetical protein JW829_00065 [Pirellulales bacterium]|nr:hypothetical protein [Pirellulales bacterium]
MPDQQESIRAIDLQELFPWVILVRALRLALVRMRILLLAIAGLIATTAGFRVVGDLFFHETPDQQVQAWREVDSPWPWTVGQNAIGSGILPSQHPDHGIVHGLVNQGLLGAWQWIARPIQRFFDPQLTWRGMFYSVLCGLWVIVVWAIFGGAITRIAALDMTRGESLGIRGAITQTSARIGSFIGAPLLPIIFALIVTLPLLILGLLIRTSFFTWLAGLGWFIVLALGFVLAIVLILFYVGWPLMWATLSVERSDAFDAFGRCYSYVYERPFRLLFSIAVATVLGWIGLAIVQVFVTSAMSLSDWSVSWGSGNERIIALQQMVEEPPPAETAAGDATTAKSPSESRRSEAKEAGWLSRNGAGAIRFWKNLLLTVIAAFPIGFLWTSSVAIYLLQRREIDATEMDEVALEDQAGTHGLPPLQKDSSGVPSVKTEDAPQGEESGGQAPTEGDAKES